MNIQNDFRSFSTINEPASFFYSDFPNAVKLNLTEDEPITLETFKELFAKAQEANLPYYLVSLVKLKDGLKSVYKVYDTIYFRGWLTGSIDLKRIPDDPQTRLQIEKIYYFALDCFDCDFKPIILPDNIWLHYHNYFNPKIYDPNENLAIDALDYHTILGGSEEEKELVKEIQIAVRNSCYIAYDVALTHVKKMLKSSEENFIVDSLDSISYSEDDMFVEVNKYFCSSGEFSSSSSSFQFDMSNPFLNSIPVAGSDIDIDIEFDIEKALCSSGEFSTISSSSSSFQFDISNTFGKPVAVAGSCGIKFDALVDNYESEDVFDLDDESEKNERVKGYKQEFDKWFRAIGDQDEQDCNIIEIEESFSI